MVGRNFWAVEEADGWQVRQEGLPDGTTRHSDREEAWKAAQERAKAEHGDAFLADGEGGYSDHACFRELPRKAKD